MAMGAQTPGTLGDVDAPLWSGAAPIEDGRTVRITRISWAAVAAGVAVALVTQALLNMLGVGLGAATLNPATGDSPGAGSFSMAAAVWWLAAGVIAAFVGGYVAGSLCGRAKPSTAGWHGLVAWAATTLVVLWMVASAVGGVVGGAASALGSAAGGIARVAGSAAQMAGSALAGANEPFAEIERQVRETTGSNDPAALRDTAVSTIRAVVSGDPAAAGEARERAAQALVRAQGDGPDAIGIQDARARIADYERQYRQSVDEAERRAATAAEAAATAVSRASLLAFFALVLGAIAAWFGGRAGAVEPTIIRQR